MICVAALKVLERRGRPPAALGALELPCERVQSSLLEDERKGSQTLAKCLPNARHICEAILDHLATAAMPPKGET